MSMKAPAKLVKRTYRIKGEHDKKVKRLAKKRSESQVVRDAIESYKWNSEQKKSFKEAVGGKMWRI